MGKHLSTKIQEVKDKLVRIDNELQYLKYNYNNESDPDKKNVIATRYNQAKKNKELLNKTLESFETQKTKMEDVYKSLQNLPSLDALPNGRGIVVMRLGPYMMHNRNRGEAGFADLSLSVNKASSGDYIARNIYLNVKSKLNSHPKTWISTKISVRLLWEFTRSYLKWGPMHTRKMEKKIHYFHPELWNQHANAKVPYERLNWTPFRKDDRFEDETEESE